MFNYDVMCLVCGKNKVYEASFKTALSTEELENNKSIGVCSSCAPNYKKLLEEKKKPTLAKGPLFKLKAGE